MEHRIENFNFNIKFIGKVKWSKQAEPLKQFLHFGVVQKKGGFMQQLTDMSWEEPQCTLESLVGVCGKDGAIMDDEFTYFMGVRYDGKVPIDMETFCITHSTWAVFLSIRNTWKPF